MYKEKVFIVAFHQVFFPGIFLNRNGIGFELVEFFFGIGDLPCIILPALLQLPQLFPLPEMGGYKITIIKK